MQFCDSAPLCYLLWVHRLVCGKDMHSLCKAAHEAALHMTPGPQLDALRTWSWKVGMQFVLYMIKVGCFEAFCCAFCVAPHQRILLLTLHRASSLPCMPASCYCSMSFILLRV